MSVLPMKHIFIAGMRKDRKQVLETLQRIGAIEIVRTEENADSDVFGRQDTAGASQRYFKNQQKAEQALAVLETYCPEDKGLLFSLRGKKRLTVEEYERRVEQRASLLELAGKLTELERRHAEKKASLPKLEGQLLALRPWLQYDLPMDYAGTRSTEIFLGTLPGALTQEQLELQLAKEVPDVQMKMVEIISTSPEQTAISIVVHKSEAEALRDGLRRLNFAKPPYSGKQTPNEKKAELEGKLAATREAMKSYESSIKELASRREELKFMADYYKLRAEKYEIIGGLAQSDRVFLLEGYTPAKCVPAVEKALDRKFELYFEASDPEDDEKVPVVLQNNGFASPVEGIVDSYSLPGKGERDPSSIVACFYYILFGFMLSDAGYGIIMTLLCGAVLLKFKEIESGTRKMLKMLLYCGISTTIVGFLFGSFFGNAVNVIAETFFGRSDIALKPIWLDPLAEPMKMLSICFAIGIVHLFVGLGVKLYYNIKDGQFLDGLYDVVFWYMLVGGSIVLLLTMPMITQMLALDSSLPVSWGNVAGIVALIGMVGIVLTSGRESKNWFKRILKGIYGVYGISGYLSDILSYSRLLALGLATGVISQVFNTMGSMVAKGKGVIGVIFFILVFVIGHVLNLLINALGAYVHTNRLTFVEFFGKFYEGGGRRFNPFAVKTQYFNVKEENEL